jgi:hypothetical protein
MAEGVTVSGVTSGVKRSRAALEAPLAEERSVQGLPVVSPVVRKVAEVSERLKAALALQTSPLELGFAKERADYVTCHGRVLAPVFVDDAAGEAVCFVDVESSTVVAKRLSYDAVHGSDTRKANRNGYIQNCGRKAHRLVVAAALGVPLSHLDGFQVDHKDSVKTNNTIANLGLYLDQREHARKTRLDNKDMSVQISATMSVPVQQVDVATGEVIATFPSSRAAAGAIGRSPKTVANCLRNGGVAAGFRWRRADALHPRLAGLIDKVKEWRALCLPDGTLVAGSQMSDNQLLKTRHGRITCGHLRGDGYRVMRVCGRLYQAHVLMCSTFHGPRPFPGAVVLHKDDKYDDVCASDLRWGTQKENVLEALGNPIDVVNLRTGERTSFLSVKEMSKTLSVCGPAITAAMKKGRPLFKLPHLRFAYAGDPMPSSEDWVSKWRLVSVRRFAQCNG